VICHCRELAHQIFKDFNRLGKYFRQPCIRYSCFFGGISVEENARELYNADTTPHIIIGTPGRLLDLVMRGILNLKRLKFLVVDECDKVFEGGKRGMRDELIRIIHSSNTVRQMLMFSATMN
jgi:ATP-dependent RNA helicase UAP56/SUB2